jgi:hypothetical protein
VCVISAAFIFYFDGCSPITIIISVGSQSILVFLMFWRARETRREKKKGIQIPPT